MLYLELRPEMNITINALNMESRTFLYYGMIFVICRYNAVQNNMISTTSLYGVGQNIDPSLNSQKMGELWGAFYEDFSREANRVITAPHCIWWQTTVNINDAVLLYGWGEGKRYSKLFLKIHWLKYMVLHSTKYIDAIRLNGWCNYIWTYLETV